MSYLAAILAFLFSVHPLKWDGNLWKVLTPEERLLWTGGAMTGLAVAAYLTDDPTLAIRSTPAHEVVTLLTAFYYEDDSVVKMPLGDALMLVGHKDKPKPQYRLW